MSAARSASMPRPTFLRDAGAEGDEHDEDGWPKATSLPASDLTLHVYLDGPVALTRLDQWRNLSSGRPLSGPPIPTRAQSLATGVEAATSISSSAYSARTPTSIYPLNRS